MQKVYPAIAVANFFIKKNIAQPGYVLTHLKLQKMLYYAQGWFLANYDRPLFEDSIEAWKYGPVIYAIYENLRGTGDRDIRETIKGGFLIHGAFVQGEPEIDPQDEMALFFLGLFWDKFAPIDAWTLVNATHKVGTPWHEVCEAYGFQPPFSATIPVEMIADYFKKQIPEENEFS